MSYDVSLTIDTGKQETQVVEIGNYTYNCSKMFINATGGVSLGILDGKECWKASGLLAVAIANLESNPEKYRVMNPKNGWGNYDTFLEFIKNIYDACLEHPKCKLRIS